MWSLTECAITWSSVTSFKIGKLCQCFDWMLQSLSGQNKGPDEDKHSVENTGKSFPISKLMQETTGIKATTSRNVPRSHSCMGWDQPFPRLHGIFTPWVNNTSRKIRVCICYLSYFLLVLISCSWSGLQAPCMYRSWVGQRSAEGPI